MFPFESDFSRYTQISEEEAKRRSSLISGADFCYQSPTGILPDSLQRVNNLAGAFVSGFFAPASSPIGSGTPLETIFITRYDAKDAPLTGNLYVFCILQVGSSYYMSPPCTNLKEIPHHFSGCNPLSIYEQR
jgi:hypothetical protein